MKISVPEHIKNLVPYVAGKPIEDLERELGISNSVKMASNENPLGPSKLALEAINKKLKSLNHYPDSGCFYLKKKLAKKLGVFESNIFLGNGSNEVIEMAVKTLMNSASNAVMAESSFVVYKIITRSIGAKWIEIPLNAFTHDLKKMAEAINKDTKIIFVANPNNPTGTIVKTNELDNFIRHVPEEVLIVIDEAYFEYVENKDYPNTVDYIKNRSNVIILRTFSKIYGLAGLRIGYAIGNKTMIDYMNRVRQPFNVNSLAQIAAYSALDDLDHLVESKKNNAIGKEFLYARFEDMKVNYISSEANFILFRVDNAEDVYQKLLHSGVIVRPMKAYSLPDYLRVTIGLKEENERFVSLLEDILKKNQNDRF